MFPGARVIVGADGSHSVVRRDVFEPNKLGLAFHQSLQYICDLKYEARTPISILSLL